MVTCISISAFTLVVGQVLVWFPWNFPLLYAPEKILVRNYHMRHLASAVLSNLSGGQAPEMWRQSPWTLLQYFWSFWAAHLLPCLLSGPLNLSGKHLEWIISELTCIFLINSHWKPVLVHQAQSLLVGSFWQGKPFPLRVKALLHTLIK